MAMRNAMKLALGAAGALVLGATAGSLAGAAPRSAAGPELFYIGMQGDEIRAARLDPKSGALTALGVVARASKPFWFIEHPRLPILYAATEGAAAAPGTPPAPPSGTVIAYRIDRATGVLAPLGQTAVGAGPTHLQFDAPSNTLLTANFGGGSATTLRIGRDGRPGAVTSEVKSVGKGPHPRQASPHAHGIELDPGGRFALVSDLGADRLFVYPFNRSTGTLSLPAAGQERHHAVPPGAGPRHTAFHPNGRIVYLVNELAASIEVLRWNGATGGLTTVQTISTDRPGFTGIRSASELLVSPDGRFVYVANRSEGAMVVYRVAPATGMLTEVQRLSTGGPSPWAFSFDRTGRWLVVAEQAEGKVMSFAVNPRTGMLTASGKSIDSPKPVAIGFVR